MMADKCEKCGREKITASVRVTGFPDMHKQGTWHEYCGYCDEPPVMTLDSAAGMRLISDPSAAEAAKLSGGEVEDKQDAVSERDYDSEPVWKLRLLLAWSVIKGNDDAWQRIDRAIKNKTGSGRPPKRRWG